MTPMHTFYKPIFLFLANVKNLVKDITVQFQPIDFIIHTADMLSTKKNLTVENLPGGIVVNYYSRVLFNHLMLQEQKFSIERIVHVALAGFNLGKNFRNKFPVDKEANGFTSPSIGQVSNDIYGLTMAKKLNGLATKINILYPGLVDTNIRKKGEVPRIFKTLWPVFELLMNPVMTKVEDYAIMVLSIINNENEAANQNVLINPKGKPAKIKKRVADEELQTYVWQETWKTINKPTRIKDRLNKNSENTKSLINK